MVRISRTPGRFTYRDSGKNILNRVDIDLRMEEANMRSEIGRFEGDSIESKRVRGKQSSCLTVLVDRLSRKTIIKKRLKKHQNKPLHQLLKH